MTFVPTASNQGIILSTPNSHLGQLVGGLGRLLIFVAAFFVLSNFNPFPLDSVTYALDQRSTPDTFAYFSRLIKLAMWIPLVTLFAYKLLFNFSDIMLGSNWILFLLGLCSLSVLFDNQPANQLAWNELILFTGIAWMTIILVENPIALSNLLYRVLTFAIVISFIGIYLLPERSIHNVTSGILLDTALKGTWKGVFFHKNFAGGMAALTVIAAFFQYMRYKQVISLFAIFGALVFLYYTNSLSAIFSLAFVVPVVLTSLALAKSVTSRTFFSLALAISFALFPFLVVTYLYPVYGLTFDSRVFIWKIVALANEPSQWLGVGYGLAFGEGGRLVRYDDSWISRMGHSHNGFMDIYIQIGLVGVMLMIFGITKSIMSYLTLLASRENEFYTAILSLYTLFIFSLLRSTMEPDFISARANWTLLVIFMLAPIYYKKRQENNNLIAIKSIDAAAK